MTEQELLEHFATRVAKKKVMTWGQFTSTLNSLSQGDKDRILAIVNDPSPGGMTVLASHLALLFEQSALVAARQEVSTMVQQNKVSVADLLTILS
jgi:hypothetical protein